MPYMDVINHHMANAADSSPYYHIGEVTNLATIYLTNYLRARGLIVDFIGLFGAETQKIDHILTDTPPLTVAITTTFYESEAEVATICAYLKQRRKDCICIVGGPLVDNFCEDLSPQELDQKFCEIGADFYIKESQGEGTLYTLISAMKLHNPIAAVPNIFYRQNQSYIFTHRQIETNSLDDNAINWELFPEYAIGPTVQMRTARSCAFSCGFCDYPVRAGKLHTSSVEVIERELRQLFLRGVRNIVFVDDTFNVPEQRFKAICRMMIKNNFCFSWFSYFRCSSAKDPETFDLMRDSGCRAVFLGIESGDATVLRNMHKVATPEQYQFGMEQLRSRGIATFASFICGYPGETEDTVQNTIDFINNTAPDFYRIEPWWYNRRAPIHQSAGLYGLSGGGYQWQHRTMNCKQACDAVDYIFNNAKGPLWCPQYSFSFWAIPYLIGKGMTLEDVRLFHGFCHRLVQCNTEESEVGRQLAGIGQIYDELQSFFEKLRLHAPRYSYRR